jgi:PadR family transcriptional regulator, regulatory protein PadR
MRFHVTNRRTLAILSTKSNFIDKLNSSMKRYSLGELEELLLLLVSGLGGDDAYGVNIRNEVARQANRNITLSTVHVTLHRLEDKGFVRSGLAEATPVRGGKRKRVFRITAYGLKTLAHTRELRERLWLAVPSIAIQKQ